MSVLVVAAHPDDEILGAGATLHRHVRDGMEVHACVLADGAGSRYEDSMLAELEQSGRRAAEEIGFASIRFEALPDQRLETLPRIEVTQRIEQIVQELRPAIVYTHFPGDVNSDHHVVASATWIACRPYACPFLRRFAVFETPSSTEWAWPLDGVSFKPNLFVDVTETMAAKLAAIGHYGSELRDYPHPRSIRAIEERAAYWGSRVGVGAAEAFCVLREIA